MGVLTSVTTAFQIMESGECNRVDNQGQRFGQQEKLCILYNEAQQVGCLQGLVSSPLEWDATSSHNVQSIIDRGFNISGMGTATPYWCAVFSSEVDKHQGSCSKGVGTSSPA